ncbi:hypothetical protein Tco_0546245 [Tanacetum coccineum]
MTRWRSTNGYYAARKLLPKVQPWSVDYVGYLEKGQIPPKHKSLINSQVSLNIERSKYFGCYWRSVLPLKACNVFSKD